MKRKILAYWSHLRFWNRNMLSNFLFVEYSHFLTLKCIDWFVFISNNNYYYYYRMYAFCGLHNYLILVCNSYFTTEALPFANPHNENLLFLFILMMHFAYLQRVLHLSYMQSNGRAKGVFSLLPAKWKLVDSIESYKKAAIFQTKRSNLEKTLVQQCYCATVAPSL